MKYGMGLTENVEWFNIISLFQHYFNIISLFIVIYCLNKIVCLFVVDNE